MPEKQQKPDPTANEEFGSAGHETGIEEPSQVGSAGLYATPTHEEGEEAEQAGRDKAGNTSR